MPQLFNSPLHAAKVDRIVQLLQLPPKARAIDAGCGTGELLLRVVSHHPASGVGVDLDADSIATAKENAAARGLASRCEFVTADVNQFAAEPGCFELGICIGSTHAFGMGEPAYANTIDRLGRLVRPGGYLLIGEGYWRQDPAPEYLEVIGDPVGIYRDHAGNISFAEERGLVALYAAVSSDDEWDDFEWQHHLELRREAEANPDDPEAAAALAHSRRWRDGYLRWGRAMMGFGVYLFRVPGGPEVKFETNSL